MKTCIALALLILAVQANAIEYREYNFKELWKLQNYPRALEKAASDDAMSDLETYTSKEDTWYRDINSFLRNFPKTDYDWDSISPEQAAPMVKNIDSIYHKLAALPQDLILFRGVDLKFRKSKSYEVGEEFVEKGYASTSTDYKVADYFANRMNDNEHTSSLKGILVLYSAKKNLKGILIDQGEDEVLLTHGERIRIMDVDKSRKFHVYLAQVCEKVCESVFPEKLALIRLKLGLSN